MNDAKIRLSQKEIELITNATWILTKNTILKKIDHYLAALQIKQKELIDLHVEALSIDLVSSSPKISKGENYKGLPYRILDFPKIFNQSDIFAIRTMFWWGNFFSVTVHLAGKYKTMHEGKLIMAYPILKKMGCYCCNNKDQWEHHFETSNYTRIDVLSNRQYKAIITENSFCKLAFNIPIFKIKKVEDELIAYFKIIIELFAD